MTRIVPFTYGRASAKLVMWDRTNATLSNVFSIERGKGHATEVLRRVVAHADKNKLTLLLEAKQYGYADKMSPDNFGLRRWYAKFGFEHVGEGMMRRAPQPYSKGGD